MIDDETTDHPPITELSRYQRRVLGVLVEKGFTTPEYYPMTLKALTAGCNQKSNRDPIVAYDEDRVFDTIEELRELGLAAVVHSESGRTERFRHYMRKRFDFSEGQLAILTELLLRGKQQMGELRSRASRMSPIDDQGTLREELRGLQESGHVQSTGPLERRGIEIDHNLYTDREGNRLEATAAATAAPPPRQAPAAAAAVDTDRLSSLQAELQQVHAENRDLRDAVETLKDEFRLLADRFDELRRDLGG